MAPAPERHVQAQNLSTKATAPPSRREPAQVSPGCPCGTDAAVGFVRRLSPRMPLPKDESQPP